MEDSYAASLVAALEAAGMASRPVGVLNLDAVDANLADLRRRAAGKLVRVASKSLRVRKLLAHSLGHEGFRGVLAFTLPEALWLAASGHRDIVLAYPTAHRPAIADLAADAEARAAVTLMIDSVAQLELIETVAPGSSFRLSIELDAGFEPGRGFRFGALRSPLRTPDAVAGLARVAVERGHQVVGLMGYEAQIAGVADAGLGAYPRVVRLMKSRSARELAERRAATVAMVARWTELEFVNGGGTGSFETTTAEPAVTEVAAGSVRVDVDPAGTLFNPYVAELLGDCTHSGGPGDSP